MIKLLSIIGFSIIMLNAQEMRITEISYDVNKISLCPKYTELAKAETKEISMIAKEELNGEIKYNEEVIIKEKLSIKGCMQNSMIKLEYKLIKN